MAGEIIVRFEETSFEYTPNKPIINEVSFTIRKGSKVTIMGQNGAGKSTLFKLINKTLEPTEGLIHVGERLTIAESRQTIPRDELQLTVREFFSKCFKEKLYDIDHKVNKILEVVHLTPPASKVVHEMLISDFSGGQQARILLASALIQDPDILLLDEPTNNLDKAGIEHLTKFIKEYKKTVIVISHDAEFLNSFTDCVLYLDVFTKKVEQYAGNYFDVSREITARIERENKKNAQLQKKIQEKKDQANMFAHKGGKLRLVARRMRELAEELQNEVVDVRKEDKTIRPFTIPTQDDLSGDIVTFTSISYLKSHKPTTKKIDVKLAKKTHLLLAGPNGVGKTTLLESLAKGEAQGVTIAPSTRIGYYRQDFSNLNFGQTVFDCLVESASDKYNHETMRGVAAGFHISSEMMGTLVGALSEGQKGLVSFAKLVMERPGLLILDEPTNHINFRHIPVIAKALHDFQGVMILVSHVPDFVKEIRIDETIDLGALP